MSWEKSRIVPVCACRKHLTVVTYKASGSLRHNSLSDSCCQPAFLTVMVPVSFGTNTPFMKGADSALSAKASTWQELNSGVNKTNYAQERWG